MSSWFLRIRALLDRQFAIVVVVLLVLALAGGWMTYTTYTTPNTATEQRTVSSWQMEGWFNHSAAVSENNSVYPVGTALTNRSIYFSKIAPVFDGTYTFSYAASESGELNGTVSLEFVLQGVEDNRDSTTVVWQTTRPLGTTSNDSFEPDETIRVPFTVDMNETINRTEMIDEQLDNPPGQPRVVIRATTEIQGTINGRTVDRVEEHALPVAVDRGTYRPGHPGVMTDRHETTRSVTVQQEYGLLQAVGAPALLSAPLVVLVGLVAVRFTGWLGLSQTEQELLAYEDDREDFDEWISTIQLPDEALDLPQAEASSLGSLVDFAIDTNNSVVENPDDDAYYVVHDGFLYTYQPPVARDEGEGALQTTDDDALGQTDVEPAGAATTDREPNSSDDTPPAE